ncbi:hypothetical protein DPX16_22646 [Anabarilius grahami]|uniref:DUF4806 domain-containing protein n=1 Tax=Anabarilius grahami TaxID=495550 RepID=A0A3N0YHK7_ANAGA|nr:hypothetical protein DPX16_22646 [Anabarilius grahami]
MYLIVEFEGEGTTGPVAKSWYADGYSWWPPYKDIDRLLKSVKIMETPQPEKASFHNVANNWKKANYTSDINSEPEIAGKRIPKKKLCSNHIYSSDDEAPEQPPLKKRKTANKESVPPAPKPPSIPKRTKKKAPVRVSQPDHHGDGWSVDPPNTQATVGIPQADHHGAGWSVDPPNTQATLGISQADHHGAGYGVDPPNTQGTSGVRQENPVLRLVPNQCTSVERAILETLEKMDMKINHLTSLVQSLVGNRRFLPPVAEQNDEEDGIFPLASTEDLDRLEQSLSDRGFMQRMVNRLSISGGPNMKKTVWRICSKVFSTYVARQLNWCGRGDKRGMRKSNIGSLLTASAMRNPVLPSPTEAEAEKYIKDYLRLAPGRV